MEKLDVYDINRIKTGQIVKRGEKMPVGGYRLVVHIVILNEEGQMLIQQRTGFDNHKTRGFLNLWDITVGGSAVSNETSQQAAHRELREEIGYSYDFSGMRPQMTFNFPTGFDDYYVIHAHPDINALKLQEEEVQRVRWAGKEEIMKMIQDGSFVPYYPEIIALLFSAKTSYGCVTHE